MAYFIKACDLNDLLKQVKRGEFFSIFFTRVAPKCEHCKKRSREWVGLTHCPTCQKELILDCETVAQKGVSNPQNDNKPNGKGVSAEMAEELWNNLKYYDTKKGMYRSCHIGNIRRLVIKQEEYFVI